MPNLYDYLGYTIYFWSNENFEPIHVHVSKGSARGKSTKILLTKNGNCIVANIRQKFLMLTQFIIKKTTPNVFTH